MAPPVRKTAVLSDFVPPIGVNSARESKQLPTSPRKTQTSVKRMEIEEFKPPYSFSPPQKLSPPKVKKREIKGSKVGKENTKGDGAGVRGVDQVTSKKDQNTIDLEVKQVPSPMPTERSLGGKLQEILLNNGKPDCEISPRKRNIDVKAAQHYMKEQKKRRHQLTEKEKAAKKNEMAEKKKKLEELRVKSLQLAAACRKKKKRNPQEGLESAGHQNDASTSLGLRADNPKRSFQQSIANLGNSNHNFALHRAIVDNKKNPEPRTIDIAAKEAIEDTRPVQNRVEEQSDLTEFPIGSNSYSAEKHWGRVTPANDVITAPVSRPSSRSYDLNSHLQKLAESLQLKIDAKNKKKHEHGSDHTSQKRRDFFTETQIQALPVVKKQKLSTLTDSASERNVVCVDVNTIASLKKEISELAEGFKTLQAKILKESPRNESIPCKAGGDFQIPDWLLSIRPRPHPYNVFTAVRNKLRIQIPEAKPDLASDFESPLEQPTTPRSVISDQISSNVPKKDSGSDLSSSILDSYKSLAEQSEKSKTSRPKKPQSGSSIQESIRSEGSKQNLSKRTISSFRENIILMPPDIKTISNNLCPEVVSDSVGRDFRAPEEKQSNIKLAEASRSSSTITEVIANLSDTSEKSRKAKFTNGKPGISDVHARLQAELSVLDTLQLTLTRIVDAEREKTQLELNKSKNEKAVNTEGFNIFTDQGVQTSVLIDSARIDVQANDTDVEEELKTETPDSISSSIEEVIEKSQESQIKESIHNSLSVFSTTTPSMPSQNIRSSKESVLEKNNTNVNKTGEQKEKRYAATKRDDTSESTAGISLQMLNRIIKDEELRSEHQLALIQLRLNSLIDKTKAELRLLETKKRALKQRGGDNERIISAIKKKQRGILLRYQSEKREIDRLKKMHQLASDERAIMMTQQKQIQRLQVNAKTMMGRLKKDGSQTQPCKNPKVANNAVIDTSRQNSGSETPISSIRTNISDFEVSSQQTLSDGEDEILKRNQKTLQQKTIKDAEKLDRCKKLLGEREKTLLQEKHYVQEIIEWENRLEVEEKRLREMMRRAMMLGGRAPQSTKIKSVEDRSTSPFQYQDNVKPEAAKKVDENDELIVTVSNDRSKSSSIQEVLTCGSIPDEIPEEISKTVGTARSDYSESFESSSEPQSVAVVEKSVDSAAERSVPPVLIKAALSPRCSGPRRNSSGSDDSAHLSHAETPSEQSDVESRITALHEQLTKRKLEADRLRREQRKKSRERLKAKEDSLLKQIHAYDLYIEKLKQDIEQESELSPHPIVKPLIKQPKAERKSSAKSVKMPICVATENILGNEEIADKSFTFEEGSVSERLDLSKSAVTSAISEDVYEMSSVAETPVMEANVASEETKNERSADVSEHLADDKIPSIDVAEEGQSGGTKEESILEQELDDITVAYEIASSESIRTVVPSSGEDESSDKLENLTSENKNKSASATSLNSEEVIEEDVSSVSSEKKISEADSLSAVKEDIAVQSNNSSAVENSPGKTHDMSVEIDEKSVAEEKKSPTVASSIEQMISASETDLSVFDEDIHDSSAEVLSDTPTIKKSSEKSPPAIFEKDESQEKIEQESSPVHTNRLANEYLSDSFESFSEPDDTKVAESEIDEDIEEKITEDIVSCEKVDEITDSILDKLLNESFNLVDIAKERAKVQSIEKLTDELSACLLEDSLSQVLDIYDRKISDAVLMASEKEEVEEEPISPENITPDIRRRIHEIMAAQVPKGASHPARRIEPYLQTTYDISPDSTSPKYDQSSDTRGNFIASLLSSPSNRREVAIRTAEDLESQPWLEDYQGLNKTTKEAEQLRLQQLQIEQEIEKLQQAAQQTPVPYYYMREIPNKPPPPYTPPGVASASDKPPPPPTSEEEVIRRVTDFTRTIFGALSSGKDLKSVEPKGLGRKDHFVHFLWDLSRDLVSEITQNPSKEVVDELLPWEKVPLKLSACRSSLRPRSEEDVVAAVMHKTQVVFGVKPGVGQESLIVRWSRKKRDNVDEILISESQAEEAGWTRYDEDVVTVKNEVTDSLLSSLLQDTADVMDAALKRKAAANS